MERFRVIPAETGMTLGALLTRRLQAKRKDAEALVRAGGVYVNRLRIRLPSVRVVAGERVTVYPEASKITPLAAEDLNIVHRDEHIIVINKAPGVPVAPTRESSLGNLSQGLVKLMEGEGIRRPYVGVVHRLDQGASGLVVFTVRGIANRSIHQQFADHSIRRSYRLRTRGRAPAQVRCDQPLIHLRNGGVRIAEDGEANAQSAATNFRLVAQLETDQGTQSIVDAELETGRTHQIRVHAAHCGFPLVGDHRYGAEADPAQDQTQEGSPARLCLHAYRLSFEHPITKEAMSFEAPLPDWAHDDGVYR